MWVDDEGERRVGGFFIDRIGKNLTEDERPGEKLTRGGVSNEMQTRKDKYIYIYICVLRRKIDIARPANSKFDGEAGLDTSPLAANQREKPNFLFEQRFMPYRLPTDDIFACATLIAL